MNIKVDKLLNNILQWENNLKDSKVQFNFHNNSFQQ